MLQPVSCIPLDRSALNDREIQSTLQRSQPCKWQLGLGTAFYYFSANAVCRLPEISPLWEIGENEGLMTDRKFTDKILCGTMLVCKWLQMIYSEQSPEEWVHGDKTITV